MAVWGHRVSLVLIVGAVLVACQPVPAPSPSAATTARPDPDATSPASTPAPTPASLSSVAPRSTPGATPSQVATGSPIHLDWVRGRLPRGLLLCEDGCRNPWGYWPVFGGLAFGFGAGGQAGRPGPVRWRWSADGTRWQSLNVPGGVLGGWEGWLWSDGTDTGAFAYEGDIGTRLLWRTTDRGRTWRKATGVASWPSDLELVAGSGRFLAASSDPDPVRLFVSEDGWAWDEVLPLPANFAAGRLHSDGDESMTSVVLQGDPSGFVADLSGPSDEEWFSTSPDGRTWTPPRDLDVYCVSLFRLSPGFVKFSGGPDCDKDRSAVLTSPDGITWQSRGSVDARRGDIELLPVGFVMRRWTEAEGGEASGTARLAYSYSPDGVTWSDLGTVPGEDAWFDALGSNAVFAFGPSGSWTAQLPNPSPHNDRSGGP